MEFSQIHLTKNFLMVRLWPIYVHLNEQLSWRCSLKIQIESLGLPTLSKLIGKTSQLEMADGTVADLVAHIVDRHGRQARKILLDQTGQLDLAIQVMVNDERFLPRGEYSQRFLKDGDAVKFMLLVGGG
jgi:sulfur carrier protein ThiS